MGSLLDVVLLALPLVSWAGWWRFFGGIATGPIRALYAGLWTVIQFAGGLALLGWTGVLSATAMIVTQIVIAGVVWLFAVRVSIQQPAREERPSGGSVVLWAVFAVVALVILRGVAYGVLLPPDGSDGSTYHLPAMIEALRAGDFAPPEAVVPMADGGPRVVDMAFLWLLGAGSIDLVLFGQLFFLPIGMASVASIAVWAGVSRHLAWAGGLSIGLIPIVVSQVSSAYVDVGAGVLLLAALALTLLYRSSMISGPWAAASAYGTIGLAAGAKFSLLVPVAVLGFMLVMHDVRSRRWSIGHALGVVVAMLGFGWYVEAFLRLGNPLWPYAVPGLEAAFPHLDTVDALVEREFALVPDLAAASPLLRPLIVWFEPGETAFMYSFDSRVAGMGPLWIMIWVPAFLTWAVISIREGEWRKVGLLGTLVFGFLAVQTYPWWTRFVWWVAVVGIVGLAWLLERATPGLRVVAAGLMATLGLLVFTLTSIQGGWLAERFIPLLDGANAVAVEAGPVVAAASATSGETIAVPGVGWGSWNTHIRGSSLDNHVVEVRPASRESFLPALQAENATMLFVPGGGIDWAEGWIDESDPCFDVVTQDVERGQKLVRFNCA